MALLSRKHEAVGLDIGHGAVKAVHLVQQRGTLAIQQMALLDAHREGILDEDELRTSMLSWLEEKGLKGRSFTVGIPQFLATTQISDFPEGAKGDELRSMVSFETAQLGGLSDEAFSNDYHVMAPKFGRQNPVLIGVCRQSVIEERSSRLSRDGLHVVDFGMNGLAVANAFFHLHPEARNEDRPSLLLDLGDESSTLLVVAGGQVLFAGSLMFGASRYTDAVASRLGCDDSQADQRKREITLDPSIEDDPLHAITTQLEGEVRNAIEHWRAGEKEELADLLLGRIWLTGGGAAQPGLADCLGRFFGCEAVVFGPTDAATGEIMPAFSAAFGLALQFLGEADICISLAPMALRWRLRRKRLFPYLLAAELIGAALIAALLVRYHFGLAKEGTRLDAQLADLRECKTLIPRLDSYLVAMDHHEKMLVPFVEKGNRARRFIATLNELHRVRGEGDFFIYVADRLSYDEQRPKTDEKARAAADDARRNPPRGGMGASLFANSLSEVREANEAELLNATLVSDVELLASMVVAGYTPDPKRNRYGALLKMADRIKQGSLFAKADIVPEPERQGIEERIFNIWDRFWAAAPFKGHFLRFMLDMPFARLDIDKSALAPSAGKKK